MWCRARTLSLALLLLACGSSGQPPAVYRVRAQVVELHGSGDDRRVTAEHEAIPSFKDRDGKPSTMPAMKMAFGISPALAPAALEPGGKYELTFDAVWDRVPVLLITAASPLPPEERLVL